MGYSVYNFHMVGRIPAANVPQLTEDFYQKFYPEKDENGDIIGLSLDYPVLNFEDEITENAHLFEPGSYLEMTGEEGETFRWYPDPDEDGYREEVAQNLFIKTYLGEKLVEKILEEEDNINHFPYVFEIGNLKITIEEKE